jgi:hypothetical protein
MQSVVQLLAKRAPRLRRTFKIASFLIWSPCQGARHGEYASSPQARVVNIIRGACFVTARGDALRKISEGMRIAVLRVCLGIEQLQYVINVDRECIARGSEASITLSNKDM